MRIIAAGLWQVWSLTIAGARPGAPTAPNLSIVTKQE